MAPISRDPASAAPGAATVRFPAAWSWVVDEAIPSFVKKHYSPKEAWKSRPFDQADGRFFFKGIQELSDLFTEERPSEIPPYFRHPKFRSSYLLYFVPLQAAKFLTVFQMHSAALEAALAHGRKAGTLRVADLGAGPGTASLGLLLWILSQKDPGELPPIHFDWFDLHEPVLKDGKALIESIVDHFPKLRGKVTVRFHVSPWWKSVGQLSGETSLVLLGNVLNEAPALLSESSSSPALQSLERLAENARGAGLLLLEPAFRRPSQLLSRIRDHFLESGTIAPTAASIWGPCLHAGRCPLAEGRDWCHFSVPTEIPGKWFKLFSRGLGSERQWLKFSYMWFASSQAPGREYPDYLKRVVSDPIRDKSGVGQFVLLSQPEVAGRLPVQHNSTLRRGDILDMRSRLRDERDSQAGRPVITPVAGRASRERDTRRAPGKSPVRPLAKPVKKKR